MDDIKSTTERAAVNAKWVTANIVVVSTLERALNGIGKREHNILAYKEANLSFFDPPVEDPDVISLGT